MRTSHNYRALDYESGSLIQSYRRKAKLTQHQLAELIGINKRSVLNWEAGSSYPQIHHLRQLITIFLERGCFNIREEQTEAQFLWEKATGSKKEIKEAFDPAWFNSLLKEQTQTDLQHPYWSLTVFRLSISTIIRPRRVSSRRARPIWVVSSRSKKSWL